MSKRHMGKIGILIFICIFMISSPGYAARSMFQNKRVDTKALSTKNMQRLQQKQTLLNRGDLKTQERKQAAKEALTSHLQDLTQIHIPAEIGRITEVYDADEGRGRTSRSKLVVHIQDLHTNPEGQLNLAKILELIKKDYNLDLVCSEGAEGEVDTSSVSRFPDAEIRRKTAMLFIKSGELTGEEYLSITKYPDLPIWGIENADIYFRNIDEFNEIMQINQGAYGFIEQAQGVLDQLKSKIYNAELLEVDQKEVDFANEKIKTDEYLAYLSTYLDTFKIPTDKYKNITLLNEAVSQEANIDQPKIMQQSQSLLMGLQMALTDNEKDMEDLMVKAQLFKDQKISPYSFYTHLKDLAIKFVPADMEKYPDLVDFVDYLTKVNTLDTTKLFTEMEELTYEVKQRLAKTQEQKDLTSALRNIKFLEGFFNLKISNEELDYYLANRDQHKIAFFEGFLKPAMKKYKIDGYVDFNPDDIDALLPKIEEFYKTVKDRDLALVNNALEEIDRRNARVSAMITGGFHTKGITRILREKGFSYIVVAPYSATEIDEENYHFLLSGQRKPISELLEMLDEEETAEAPEKAVN